MKIDSGLRALPVLATAGLALALAPLAQPRSGPGRSAGLQTITDFAKAGSLAGETKDPIDYTARPPVVAPPNGAPLPAPAVGTTTTTALAAHWPNDPDAQAAALKAEIATANENGRKIKILPGLNMGSAGGPVVDQNSPENFKTTP